MENVSTAIGLIENYTKYLPNTENTNDGEQ